VNDHLTLAIPPAFIDAIAERVVQLLRTELGPGTTEPPVSPWLTVDQACIYIGLSKDAIYKLTAAGGIPTHKKQGGQGLRFHRAELDGWMENQYPRVDRLA
jgi:excisionase family DNA binding protein